MPQTPTPFDWSAHISNRLRDHLDLPLEHKSIEFPLETVTSELKNRLGLSEISWESGEGLPFDNLSSLSSPENAAGSFFLPILESDVTWVISHNDLKKLLFILLRTEASADEVVSPDLIQGVHNLLMTQLLAELQRLDYKPTEGALIKPVATDIPTSGVLYPITLYIEQKPLHTELFVPYTALAKMKALGKVKSPPLSEEQKRSLKVAIAFEVGATSLSLAELKSLKKGDCLFLDRCTIDPVTYHGNIALTIGDEAFSRGKIKDNQLKLLEYPFDTLGAATNMETFDSNEEKPEGETPWLEDETTPTPEAALEEVAPPIETLEPAPGKPLSSDQIPLVMKVELGRIEMSAGKLMELAPGQIIDLNVQSEQGVDCTISGKKVARGQLVKLGEMIGVRITEIHNG